MEPIVRLTLTVLWGQLDRKDQLGPMGRKGQPGRKVQPGMLEPLGRKGPRV